MKNNITKHIRISSELDLEIKKLSSVTGIKESDLVRFLLNTAIKKIKGECHGNYEDMEFSLRKI